jgi:hypothetical protein
MAESSSDVKTDNILRTTPDEEKIFQRKVSFSTMIITLITEGGLNFFHYLKNLGLSREPNLIVLSSRNQYNYDKNDLKSVRIIINLKKLNLIKHLDLFLNSLCRVLPPDAGFIGYFSNNKTLKENGFQINWITKLHARLKNFLFPKTGHFFDENEVSELLEKNGFEVMNMTKMNGLTYFYSHNNNH